MSRFSLCLVALASWPFAIACGDQPSLDQGPPPAPAAAITPSLPMMWNEIRPGGETACARGGEYSFFVYPGKVNKVIIDFMGGGACWTQESCSKAGSLFSDSIDDLRDQVKNGYPGVYNKALPDNPFADWYHVVVSYCTGDIHWGDHTMTYGTGADAVTIQHNGAKNSLAVLDWVYKNFPAPEKVLVTGCSAGSYGSIYWAPHVRQHYGTGQVLQFGDSGAGVVTDDFFRGGFPAWNATAHAPDWIPTLDPTKVDFLTLSLPDLYTRLGAFYPDLPLGQFNSAQDSTQIFFYQAMGGGSPTEWSKRMFASIDAIHQTTPNFTSFIADGTQHCVLINDDVTTLDSNMIKFGPWLRQYISGQPVKSVECDGCRPMP